MRLKSILFGFFIIQSSFPLFAATTTCQDVELLSISVQGSRDDSMAFQNKLILTLDKTCVGKSYVHADLNHPAFDGFLSIALSAKAMNKKVTISVNTSNTTSMSNQIAYISISQ